MALVFRGCISNFAETSGLVVERQTQNREVQVLPCCALEHDAFTERGSLDESRHD